MTEPQVEHKEKEGQVRIGFETAPSKKHRDRNEDTFIADSTHLLFGVFDGMGGHPQGDLASHFIKGIVEEQVRSTSLIGVYETEDFLAETLVSANDRLEKTNCDKDPDRALWMGTTATLGALVRENDYLSLLWAHVGDCRIYVLDREGCLVRVTQDDGVLTEMVKAGRFSPQDALRIEQAQKRDELSDEEYSYFRRRNQTFSLGFDAINIHHGKSPLWPGEKILFCTDGIHDNLTDQEIEKILKQDKDPRKLAQKLVKKAQEISGQDILRSKFDDMTALVVQVY